MAKKRIDPKKAKYPPTADPTSHKSGSAAIVKREAGPRGKLKAHLKKDFGGVTQATMKQDAAVRAKTGDRSFSGAPAPRGGTQKPIAKSGNVVGGTKKMLKASKRRVNKNSASPQAKRSAKKLY